ncbi:MAG: nuclear transport factor 2 family protein [Steroidobacteraceae bacterium]
MTDTLDAVMKASHEQNTEAFLSHLTDDVEYHYHVGSRPLLGKEWVRKFLVKYRTITADVVWRVDRCAESGNCLFVEGYEEYLDRRTGKRIAHPYMGILEFKGPKIAKWRDYFEMNHEAQA